MLHAPRATTGTLEGISMARRWYIESKNGDTWRSVSDDFGQWVEKHAAPKNFGWSEGDTVKVNEQIELFCFAFPEHHGEKIELFGAWASTTGRLFGEARNGKIYFPNNSGLVVTLPPEKKTTIPPWLK